MTRPWIRLLTVAIFLMAQVPRAASGAEACSVETGATCPLACCANSACGCDMVPHGSPAKPAPIVPAPPIHESRFMPSVADASDPHWTAHSFRIQSRPAAPVAFMTHSPPALALHCALLI